MTHTGRQCSAHSYHSPRPVDNDVHHLLPIGWGGPDTKDNRVPLCQTGHRSVHVLLNFYRKHNGQPPWELRREFGPGEREIAAEGWKRYTGAKGVANIADSEQQL